MAEDSGQRLLDVIGDPNALDEFLGTLTSEAATDNLTAVESLARSLAAEFDVDSPNETLFDSSSTNLTDISQSAVPFDFGTAKNCGSDDAQHHAFSSDLSSMHTPPSSQFNSTLDLDQSQYDGNNSTTTLTTSSNYCDSNVSTTLHHHGISPGNPGTNTTRTNVFTSNSSEIKVSRSNESETLPGIQYISQESSSLSASSSTHDEGMERTSTQISAATTTSSNSIAGNTKASGVSLSSRTTTSTAQSAVTQSNGSSIAFVATSTEQAQYASIGQLVQAPMLTGMNSQLLTTNPLNAQGGASFIIDPSTGQPVMVAGGNTFGTNLLMAGVQPTYTVLPTQASLFSNAITMQPQIQAIKTTHGTTTSFIQGTSLVSQAQSTGSNSATTPTFKSKNPPHLLPKPLGGTGSSGNSTTPTSTSAELAPESTASVISSSANVVVTSSATSMSMSNESLNQIIQQQAVISSASGGMALNQPSFAIGAGGQVVQVSGMQTLNSISGSSQAIIMNQFGQQMLVPAGMSQGVQYIVRQQPQVLAIQTPAATAQISAQQTAANGKVVRLVQAAQQMPQVTQNSIQLQQIQTPQGPQWVAVRSSPIQQPVVSIQPPPSPVPVVVNSVPTTPMKASTPPPSTTPPKSQPVVNVTTDTISACIQSVIERLKSPSPPLTSTVPSQHHSSPISSVGTDCSSTDHNPPPKKKPKYSKKKKVTLDLEQLLKQSGIMDEDLQDDDGFCFGDFFGSSSTPEADTGSESLSEEKPPVAQNQQNGVHHNNNNLKTENFYKPNGAPAYVPTVVPPHSHILKPSTKSKQKRAQVKESSSEAPSSPRSKSKGKLKNKGVDVISNSEYSNSSCSPPSTPKSVKGKKGKKNSEEIIDNHIMNNICQSEINSTSKSKPKGKTKKKNMAEEEEEGFVEPPPPPPPQMPSPSVPATPAGPRRIVQTIQLSPQNQMLLKNIQAQIQKLVSLTTRNEIEESALQKLISLQSQVINTGKQVPNPPHLQTLNSTPQGTSTVTAPVQLKLGTGVGNLLLKTNLPSDTVSRSSVPEGVVTNGLGPVPAGKSISVSPKTVSSNTSQPPPLVLNKSCTNTKLIVTSTNSSNGNNAETPENQKSRLLSSQLQSTVDELTAASSGEMTSSAGNIIPTTTISTSVCGSTNNGAMYYNSFDPALTAIDEKKLEEQLIARLKQEEEAKIQWRKDEFEKHLATDQKKFVNPDYHTGFKSVKDAVERLMHFHVARDTAEITFEEFDEDFAETSSHLLNKFSGMVSKYRALLLKESMKDVECADRVMLERMFVAEEKLKLEHDRQLVQQGEVLELPPPPSSWVPRIRQMVDAELKEMERDSLANMQVQSAVDSIMSFDSNGGAIPVIDDKEKVEYDAFGVPISSSNFNSGLNPSSADIDEAVRSILL